MPTSKENVAAHFAGSFYPASKSELQEMISALGAKAKKPCPDPGPLRALVMPHAGYIYSGATAAQGAATLTGKTYQTVLVMAPDHRVGLGQVAVSSAASFSTPLGEIPLAPLAAKLTGEQPDLFAPNSYSDEAEHAVEVTLPFLQTFLGHFNLVPMVIGAQSVAEIAQAIGPELNDQTLLVASSDLSHFLSDDEARAKDKETLDAIMAMDQGQLLVNDNKACGLIPIRVIMTLAEQNNWRPMLLDYSTSAESSGDRERVVGYAAIAFYDKETKAHEFSRAEQDDLLQLARETIRHGLRGAETEEDEGDDDFPAGHLYQPRGVFVTLHKDKELRGCIGSIMPVESLVDSIRHNASSAAFHDPRFKPVTAEELTEIDIEISVLSPPCPLPFTNHDELLTLLKPHHGVVLQLGHCQATFLPQVWQQLPQPQQFLEQLSVKAGLQKDDWRQANIEISIYTVESFGEEEREKKGEN
ncbi:MAG: AmmeMemoRadiSam system protein B [Thermodesulfobacteriota bacterium]